MTMVNNYVTDGVLQDLCDVDPSLLFAVCYVGNRQDDELILEKHPRPFALPIDEMDAWF